MANTRTWLPIPLVVLAAMTATTRADLEPISLSEDGAAWMSIGGQARLRIENWSHFAFGAPANDNETFALGRLLVHADFHLSEHLRAFVEGKSALSTDRDLPGGRRTLDVDTLALEQAYVDIGIPVGEEMTLTLRPGRQVLKFGKERLVSPLPWSNTQRRWDGISAKATCRGWTFTGFFTQFVPTRKYEFNESEADIEFYGLYVTGPVSGIDSGLDLYYLGLERGAASINGTSGPEDRHTWGGRLFSQFEDNPWDYDVEGAYQFGSIGASDVSAFMFAAEAGFTAAEIAGKPRLFAGVDYATGDDAPGGNVETFDHLFPLGHAFLGYMDFVGRQNVIAINLGASAHPIDRMTARLAGHLFLRESDDDALYNAGGGVVRAGAAAADSEIGYEIDLTVAYKFDEHLSGLLGYSHFFAGDFIEETGTAEDMDFLYAQLQFSF